MTKARFLGRQYFRWRDASYFIVAGTRKAVVKPGLSARLKLRQWRWKPESAVNQSVIQVGISSGSVSNTDLDVSGALLIEGTSISLATVATVQVSQVVCDVARESSRQRPILTAAIIWDQNDVAAFKHTYKDLLLRVMGR